MKGTSVVSYRNTRTGRVVHMSAALPSMDRSARWERVDAAAPVTESVTESAPLPKRSGPFDPGEHTVVQVNEYLAGADVRERERVLQAEAEGRGRRGILSGPHSDLSGA